MTIQGRQLSNADIELIRSLMAQHPDWLRSRLSIEICKLWNRRTDRGVPKDMACRSMLRKLEDRKLIVLPLPARIAANHVRRIREISHRREPITCTLRHLQPVEPVMVQGSQDADHLFHCLMDRYHYLGCRVTVGEHIKYMVYDGQKRPLGCLLSGMAYSVESPYFSRASSKPGRKSKKRKVKNGYHLGLSYPGLIDRCSGVLTSSVVQAAVLCPSFEIARKNLQFLGIEMDIKTTQRLCMSMGDQGIENRHRLLVSKDDVVENRILVVCIDGGRLRERRAKRGRQPSGEKRRGYHTDWREPTQPVIQWLDDDGRKCKDIPPIYDATMGDTDAALDLLAKHLRHLECDQAAMVIFCADGAKRYWRRFGKLAEQLTIGAHLEVIDYTHAKQNLDGIILKNTILCQCIDLTLMFCLLPRMVRPAGS